jgi:hypothetical protein
LAIDLGADTGRIAPHPHGKKIVQAMRCDNVQQIIIIQKNPNRRRKLRPGCNSFLERAKWRLRTGKLALQPLMHPRLIGHLPRHVWAN